MHSRRFSMLLVGIWLGAGLFLIWMVREQFNTVDRALKPTTRVGEQAVNDIGVEKSRVFLRYHAAEQSRAYLYQWGFAQLVLGGFLLVVLLFATNANKLMTGVAVALLALTALQHFLVMPRITELGRALDFANVDEMRDERRGYWNYERTYSYLDLAKFSLLLLVAARLVVSSGERRRRRRKSGELDMIDDAQNGHVDRRVRSSHRRHRREAFGGEEDEVADAGVDGVERD